MKKIASLLLIFAINFVTNAQDNYMIKSSVKTEGLPEDLAAFGEMDITTYVKGDKTKTETSGMMFSTTVYFDSKTLTYLTEYMGNKSGYVLTKQELDENEKKEKKGDKTKIEYTSEKKKIAGYECTKAIITTYEEDKKEPAAVSLSAPVRKENITIAWITDKIKQPSLEVRKANKRGLDLGDLKGVPLEMESKVTMNGSDVKFVMTTKEVSTAKIDDSVFTANTEGYNMMSHSEMMEMMKKMGGK